MYCSSDCTGLMLAGHGNQGRKRCRLPPPPEPQAPSKHNKLFNSRFTQKGVHNRELKGQRHRTRNRGTAEYSRIRKLWRPQYCLPIPAGKRNEMPLHAQRTRNDEMPLQFVADAGKRGSSGVELLGLLEDLVRACLPPPLFGHGVLVVVVLPHGGVLVHQVGVLGLAPPPKVFDLHDLHHDFWGQRWPDSLCEPGGCTRFAPPKLLTCVTCTTDPRHEGIDGRLRYHSDVGAS